MEFDNEDLLEQLYNSEIIANLETSKEYQKLIKKYNNLYSTIEDAELKKKIKKLNELINEMSAENGKTLFKIGFSKGVKMIIEALKFNP